MKQKHFFNIIIVAAAELSKLKFDEGNMLQTEEEKRKETWKRKLLVFIISSKST